MGYDTKSSMRLLAIADTHLGFEIGRTPKARNFTYEAAFRQFEKMVAIAEKEQVDAVIHGGDLFNKSKPREKVIKKAYNIIESFLDKDIGFYIVAGNHERSILPNSLLRFHKKSNFFTKFETIKLDEINIIGFPYTANPTKLFWNIIDEAKKEPSKPHIVLCHQLFAGATFGPHQFKFVSQPGVLKTNSLPYNVPLIISGHIHRAQALQNNRIIYPGSLERTSFVELVEPKGYIVIDITKEDLFIDFIKIESSPMQVIEIDATKEINYSSLSNRVPKGYIRTLLRFTGRHLTENEIERINQLFPAGEYPLLTFSPRFSKQLVKPLYSNYRKRFYFPHIRRKLRLEKT